jgi:putative flippase GtrA
MDELIKFSVTGILGTMTNLLVFFICVDVFKFLPTPVSTACFCVSVTQNYIINHRWSFKKKTNKIPLSIKMWLQFTLGSLLGLAVNILVMNVILARFTLPYKFIAQGCGIASGMIVNFIVSKSIVFRKREK